MPPKAAACARRGAARSRGYVTSPRTASAPSRSASRSSTSRRRANMATFAPSAASASATASPMPEDAPQTIAVRPSRPRSTALVVSTPTTSRTAAADSSSQPRSSLAQVELDDLLDPARAELDRDAHVEAVDPVLALEVGGARAGRASRRARSRRPSARPPRPARTRPRCRAGRRARRRPCASARPSPRSRRRRRASSAARRRRSSPRRPAPSGRRGRRAPSRSRPSRTRPVSQAMKVEKRAVSRMPAIPKTRSFGQPETFFATWHIASSGFETTIRIASGRGGDHLLGHGRDDLLVRRHEVVAAHARLAREAGRDHDDLGARRLVVAVRARDLRPRSRARRPSG